jgi:hypothetical protein
VRSEQQKRSKEMREMRLKEKERFCESDEVVVVVVVVVIL